MNAEEIINNKSEEEADDLTIFLRNFLKHGCPIGYIPLFNPIHKVEEIISITWYRKGQYQIQLFIVPPNYIVPEHTHPNVDSYEIYLGGQINFTMNGDYTVPKEQLEEMNETPTESNLPKFRGNITRVKPEDKHGGFSGPHGAVFMSIQKWLNGVEPHCVAMDYDGIAIGKSHAENIKFGKFSIKENLTKDDALGI